MKRRLLCGWKARWRPDESIGASALRPDRGTRDETSQHHALTTSHRFRYVSQSILAMSFIFSSIPIEALLTQDTNVVASVMGRAAAADAGNKLLAAEPLSSSKRQ